MSPDRPVGAESANDIFRENSRDFSEKSEKGFPTLNEMRVFAQRLLGGREYGVLELKNRLVKKWSSFEQTERSAAELVATLQSEGLVSDERFAESFIRSRCQRYQGPFKIHAELRRRQVPEEIIQAGLAEIEHEWVDLAVSWLTRKTHETMDYAAKTKYYRRLTNRGFNHQQAMEALNRHQIPADC